MLIKEHLIDILLFVQDPGAANFVAPLFTELREKGMSVKVLTSGIARDYLSLRGIDHEPISSGNSAEEVIASFSPRLLVVGTACDADTFAFPLIHAARDVGIPSIGFVDAAMNPEKRFCGHSKEAFAHAPDWILVPDVSIKNAFVELGASVDRVIVCGHPHFDFVREVGMALAKRDRVELRERLFPGLKSGQKVVVFVSEASARLDPLKIEDYREYTLHGRGNATGRTEIVLEELLAAVDLLEERPYFVLRAHPKDAVQDYDSYRDEVDLVSAGGDPLELLFAADLVVGMTSMSMVEAALMEIPILLVIPRAIEMDWLSGIISGAIKPVQTSEALQNEVKCILQNGSRPESFPMESMAPLGSTGIIMSFIRSQLGIVGK
jgi:predicted glycosyltransferase